jgi:hypothetical protein
MTDFLVELERSLDQAADRLERGVRAPRRAWRPHAPVALVAASLTAFALVVGVRVGVGTDDEAAVGPAAGAGADVSLLETLGVLRRPQTEADRGPEVRKELAMFSADPEQVRVIRLTEDRRPIMVAGPMDAPAPAPQQAGAQPGDSACVYYPDPVDGGGVTCHAVDDIRAGRAMGALGQHWYTLVPDGVAKVRLVWADHEEVVPVADNFAEAEASAGDRTPFPRQVTWEDAQGQPMAFASVSPAPALARSPEPLGEPRLSVLERPAEPRDERFIAQLRKEGLSDADAQSARVAFERAGRTFWVYRHLKSVCLAGVARTCTSADAAVSDTPVVGGLASPEGVLVDIHGLIHDGPDEVVVRYRDGNSRSVPVHDNAFAVEAEGVVSISWIGLDGKIKEHDLGLLRRTPDP